MKHLDESAVLFSSGVPLLATHTAKSGRRYRYYVSREADAEATPNGRMPRWRLPAREIERLVEDAVVALFAKEPGLMQVTAGTSGASPPEDGARTQFEGVQRVELGTDSIALRLDLSSVLGTPGAGVRHVLPVRIRRRGVEMRLVLPGQPSGASEARIDPALVKAVVRVRQLFEDLASGRARSHAEIARAEGVTRRYVARLLPLAFLAPDLVTRILTGTQPVDLTAETLTKRIDLPLGWAEQRARLNFD